MFLVGTSVLELSLVRSRQSQVEPCTRGGMRIGLRILKPSTVQWLEGGFAAGAAVAARSGPGTVRMGGLEKSPRTAVPGVGAQGAAETGAGAGPGLGGGRAAAAPGRPGGGSAAANALRGPAERARRGALGSGDDAGAAGRVAGHAGRVSRPRPGECAGLPADLPAGVGAARSAGRAEFRGRADAPGPARPGHRLE